MISEFRSATFAVVFFLCSVSVTFGQLDISYPTERTVFQRDNNNRGSIQIAGNFTLVADRIEAQLVPIQGGNATGWITIASSPQGGFYNGSLTATGGWYRLEVRSWRGDQVVGTATIQKVGIGEVFIVAGQSNAQGYFNLGAQGANDDRVNCYNYYNLNDSGDQLTRPEFSHLNSDSYIAPRGNSSWGWGRLGDQLASRLGVPILFYNTGWYGAGIKNWSESINGPTYSLFGGAPFLPSGMPYNNLRLVIQTYVSLTGVRAVLWHQGETDTYAKTSAQSYKENLEKVINQSRIDAGRNISWVIARASYSEPWGGTYSTVINAQNEVIQSLSNIFYGPETDGIGNRSEGVHFQNEGLTTFGDAWNNSLNTDFFNQSQPQQPLSFPKINVSCSGDRLNLKVEGDYSSVSWSNGQSGSTINVGTGNYRAKVKDNSGNVFYSAEVRVSGTIQPSKPTISLEGSNPVCLGNTTTLVSSSNENPLWTTGSTGQRLQVTTSGDYKVTVKNAYGCEATSDVVAMTVLTSPLPAVPTITASGATTFCQGGDVTLQSNSVVKTRWSTGQEGATLQVTNTGDYRASAVDDKGCYSNESSVIRVDVNPIPAQPVIITSGSTTFCEKESVQLSASYDNGLKWSTGATSKTITSEQSGNYTVVYTDSKGCASTSNTTTVKVNPLPATPVIEALRPATFCSGDYTQLRSNSTLLNKWSNGETGQQIESRISAEYTVTATDGNGCVSEKSAVLRVTSNPNPPKPTITASGSTTFCADQNFTLESTAATAYSWSNGLTTKSISPSASGTYFVQTKNEFNCSSELSLGISINVLILPPAPTIRALSETFFCQGSDVILTANEEGNFKWNDGTEHPSLSVTESGLFSTKIRGENGCFSLSSNSIRVDVVPNPQQPIIKKTGPYTLEATTTEVQAGIYIWKVGSNVLSQTGQVIKITQAGNYTTTKAFYYSDALTCFSEESASYLTQVPENNSSLIIYPNPSQDGIFQLELFENINSATIQVFDILGRKLTTLPASFIPRKSINLSFLQDGIYILQVSSGNFNQTQKIIIRR